MTTWPEGQPFRKAPKDRPILAWGDNAYGVVMWCACRKIWALVECSGNLPDKECPVDWGCGLELWWDLPIVKQEDEE